jgi:hypothetical protein
MYMNLYKADGETCRDVLIELTDEQALVLFRLMEAYRKEKSSVRAQELARFIKGAGASHVMIGTTGDLVRELAKALEAERLQAVWITR